MKTLRLLLAAILALGPVTSASAFDRPLNNARIKDNGDVRLADDLRIGRKIGSRYISTPDALQIQGADSTGDVPLLTIPKAGAAANTLVNLLGNVVDAAAFRQPSDGDDWAPALARARDALSAKGGVLRISTPGILTVNTTVAFSKSGPNIALRCDGFATKLKVGPSLVGPMFNVGGPDAGGAMPLRVEDCGFLGNDSGGGTAFNLQNANTMTFQHIKAELLGTFINSANSFAVTLNDIHSDGVQSLFYSSTKAHNFVGRRIKAYGGGTTIRFDDETDNASIVESDLEINGTPLQMAGGSGLRFVGNYVEYMTSDPIYSTAPLYGTDFSNNWVALGRSNWSIVNWVGGQIKGNNFYSQSVTFGPGTVDVEVGDNKVSGGAQIINPTGSSPYTTQIGAIPASPYQAPVLSNSWSQQANYSLVGFRKARDGRVNLRGNLVNTTAALGTAAFTLPDGYRPSTIRTVATSNSAGGLTTVQMNPNGQVVIMQTSGQGTSGNPYQASLDGIAFEPGT